MVSAVGEISAANEFYDYDAKYNNDASKTYIPARISEESAERIRATALKAYRAMGCCGLSRVDFFLCMNWRIPKLERYKKPVVILQNGNEGIDFAAYCRSTA